MSRCLFRYRLCIQCNNCSSVIAVPNWDEACRRQNKRYKTVEVSVNTAGKFSFLTTETLAAASNLQNNPPTLHQFAANPQNQEPELNRKSYFSDFNIKTKKPER